MYQQHTEGAKEIEHAPDQQQVQKWRRRMQGSDKLRLSGLLREYIIVYLRIIIFLYLFSHLTHSSHRVDSNGRHT